MNLNHMKMSKSKLKEAVKAITRECLSERCGGGHLSGGDKGKRMFKHIKQGYKGEKSPDAAASIAAATVNKNLGENDSMALAAPKYSEADEIKLIKVLGYVADILISFHDAEPEMASPEPEAPEPFASEEEPETEEPSDEEDEFPMNEAAYKQVAHAATDAKEDKARRIQNEPKVNETAETLPPNKGQYKTVAPHAYTTADQNKALTVQSDPEVNEGDDKWIQKAVKHLGRCAHMGSPECPEGSPQYNLAKRFKKGDIHKANMTQEAGLTSENGGGYDEAEEIKLLKVIKHVSNKLVAMHSGMSAEEEPPVEEPSEEPEVPFTPPEEPSEPSEEPSEEPSDEEPPKKKKEKAEEDPTEFTKKLAKENHKVQKRSYVTSNDGPQIPKNVADPYVPNT